MLLKDNSLDPLFFFRFFEMLLGAIYLRLTIKQRKEKYINNLNRKMSINNYRILFKRKINVHINIFLILKLCLFYIFHVILPL